MLQSNVEHEDVEERELAVWVLWKLAHNNKQPLTFHLVFFRRTVGPVGPIPAWLLAMGPRGTGTSAMCAPPPQPRAFLQSNTETY